MLIMRSVYCRILWIRHAIKPLLPSWISPFPDAVLIMRCSWIFLAVQQQPKLRVNGWKRDHGFRADTVKAAWGWVVVTDCHPDAVFVGCVSLRRRDG